MKRAISGIWLALFVGLVSQAAQAQTPEPADRPFEPFRERDLLTREIASKPAHVRFNDRDVPIDALAGLTFDPVMFLRYNAGQTVYDMEPTQGLQRLAEFLRQKSEPLKLQPEVQIDQEGRSREETFFAISVDAYYVLIEIYSVRYQRADALSGFIEAQGRKRGAQPGERCKPISESCMKCPNRKIICTGNQ